ncbi:MAG: hypothetical protein AB7V27_10805 [Candidatus Binatia bacterium]
MRRISMGLVVALIGACSAASKDERPLTTADIAGTVVLETYSLNLTWGYELKGMYIDGDGGVWSYSQRGTPWYPEKLKPGELSERDMLTKHRGATQIGTVDLQQLVEMARMIDSASRAPITRGHGNGEGIGSLDVAYRFDREKRVYSEVILAGTGDQIASNPSASAAALRNYLREVERAVGEN